MKRNQEQYCYRGPVKGIVFDWAGTTIDYGSLAPTLVFLEVFSQQGVQITLEEARGPMGVHKRDHIRALLQDPQIAVRWEEANGVRPTEEDIDAIYHRFLPLQKECITHYASPIPGCIETINALREKSIKIGSSTGYTCELMKVLLPEAKKLGYEPDAWVCSEDVPQGRPAPWMIFENMKKLDIFPPASIVKVDDTASGIIAGHNAGVWTVAVVKTGNAVGLSLSDMEKLNDAEVAALLEKGYATLGASKPHYMIEGVEGLMPVIEDIEQRLANGECP